MEHLVFAHGVVIAQMKCDELFGSGFAFLSVWSSAGPDRESVLLALLDTHTKVTLVLKAAEHYGMTCITKAYIVRTTLKRSVIPYLNISECGPAH